MPSVPPWPDASSPSELQVRWHGLCQRCGAPAELVESTWRELVGAYSSAGRHYHTLEHIGEMLGWIDQLASTSEPDAALEFATWLHDVVYDTTRDDNEIRSAEWAESHLAELGATADLAAAVGRLVRSTAHHAPDETDRQACILADADLAILGAPPARYRQYVDDVRREYHTLTDAEWSSGRRQVLESFLARSRIYHDPSLEAYERRARRNMTSELGRMP